MKVDYNQNLLIERLPGIGEKRTAALSRLGVRTIGQFIAKTSTASGRSELGRELHISERMVFDFRQKAICLSGREHQHKRKLVAGFVFALLTIVLGLLLISGGTVIASLKFKESRFPTFALQILENDALDYKKFGWLIVAQSRLQKSGVNTTSVEIKPDLEMGFEDQFPESIPDGLFISWLTKKTVLKSASAKIRLVEIGAQTVEGPWIQGAALKKNEIEIPTIVENISHLENFPGINFIVQLDKNSLPRKLPRTHRVDFSLVVEFEDTGFENPLNRYTDGEISVHYILAASEQHFLGVNKKKWGDVEFPGKTINLKETFHRIERLEYMWRPEMSGNFVSPDAMLGKKQYWKDGQQKLEGSFVFRAIGAKWFSYLVSIVGFPIAFWGLQMSRKYYFRLKSYSRGADLIKGK